MKRYLLIAFLIVAVLALLYAVAWHHDHPQWHSMPERLTQPPDVDRSRIPLGPYTVNIKGLIAGWGKNSVTFYVVVRPETVSFQVTGEVGHKLEGALSVAPMTVSFSSVKTRVPTKDPARTGQLFDGLRPDKGFDEKHQWFEVPGTHDAYGNPIKVSCSLGKDAFATLVSKQSFQGIRQGSCRAYFRPRKQLYAVFTFIPSGKFSDMATLLPKIYSATSSLIQGDI